MAWWLFQNLVITTALAAVVAAVCRVTRIGPVARHALWVVVLVKFVTPPLVVWPWAVPDPLGLATIDVRVDVRTVAGARDDRGGTETAPSHHDAVAFQTTMKAPGLVDGVGGSASVGGASLFAWFLWLWAAGSLVVLAVEAIRLVRLARRVAAAGPADPAIVTRMAELSARLGLPPVPVATLAGGASPMVWCLGRPRLLWPANLSAESTENPSRSSGACIDGVIVHELAHIKRGDHLIGWLELLAGIVWWWNPLFWFVQSSLREQAELACDAWVISALPDGRRAYAESLLALSGAIGFAPSRSMALIGIRPGSRRALERRLVMIMKGRAPLRLPMAGLFALALMAAATLPAWATSSQQQTPPVPLPPSAPAARPLPQMKPLPEPPTPSVAVEIAPEPPQPPPTPARRQAEQGRMPQGRQVRVQPSFVFPVNESELPADGRQLVETFNADGKAIREEANRKIDERREGVTKALQNLQEQYAKAGKLDEAVAIRDYLRAGGPRRDDLLDRWMLDGWVLRR